MNHGYRTPDCRPLGATLIYLLIDTYPIVKSFRDTVITGSFWLLAILFTVLNTIAFGALTITIGGKMAGWVGPQASSVGWYFFPRWAQLEFCRV